MSDEATFRNYAFSQEDANRILKVFASTFGKHLNLIELIQAFRHEVGFETIRLGFQDIHEAGELPYDLFSSNEIRDDEWRILFRETLLERMREIVEDL